VAILEPTTLIVLLVAAVAVVLVPVAWKVGTARERQATARQMGDVTERGRRLLEEAQRNAETRLKDAAIEAKEIVYRARAELEQEAKERQKEVQALERRLSQKEEQVTRRLDQFDRRDRDYHAREEGLRAREQALKEIEARQQALIDEQRRQLERIAGLTAEEAKQRLLAQMEAEARREATLTAMRLEEEAREGAEKKAREVLATTIQRLAPDYTVETAVSIVDLPSDDMKGRIIGREGRNIRALELATGVDLIVDDTPEAVIISAYDPLRREVARLALQRLIADGRIHPARIEEVVEKVKKEIDQHLKEEGDRACFEVGVHGLHPELVKLVGRLKFRTSYGQNCLQHSKEVAWLSGMLAAEVGADVKLAKRCGLLHDIGKALTHEQEGTHVELSVDVITRYNEPRAVLNTILAGHDEQEPETIEAVLVEAADGISAARPGARRDVLESYIKRVKAMEDIARSFKGVEAAYAIQAGRELRIITKSDLVSDLDTYQLAKDIAKRIEAEMQYPGHIKVTVIREHRATEFAR
jgi:ribonuclease Y